MRTRIIICTALLAVVGTVCRSGAGDGKVPKVLAKAVWKSNQLGARVGFIRDAKGAALLFAPTDIKKSDDPAEQQAATAKLAQVFKVKTIDWSRQMVLLVEAGQRKTGGYQVEVTGMDVKDKTLVVKWRAKEPAKGAFVIQAITYPAAALLVERFDGPIMFDPTPK